MGSPGYFACRLRLGSMASRAICRAILSFANAHPAMRQALLNLEESRIREFANAGSGRSDVQVFWFGERDEVTSQFGLPCGG